MKIEESKWTRSSTGILAGVCKGLAHKLSLDVMLVRLVFIFSVIFFGFGLGLYIILAFSFPREDMMAQAYDNRIFGVCSRLALRFHLDVGLVRALFLFLFFAGIGSPFLIYLILYFVLPSKSELQKI